MRVCVCLFLLIMGGRENVGVWLPARFFMLLCQPSIVHVNLGIKVIMSDCESPVT